MFHIIWRFGNKSHLLLLILNLIWIFVCGFKGNEWAWRNGDYDSTKTFMKVQETWNRAGLACFIVSTVFFVVFFLFSTMMAMLASIISQGQY